MLRKSGMIRKYELNCYCGFYLRPLNYVTRFSLITARQKASECKLYTAESFGTDDPLTVRPKTSVSTGIKFSSDHTFTYFQNCRNNALFSASIK